MASTLQLSRDPGQGRSVCSGSAIQSASGLGMASCCSRQEQTNAGRSVLAEFVVGVGQSQRLPGEGQSDWLQASQGRLWVLADAVGGRAERALHGWTWWVQLGERSTER